MPSEAGYKWFAPALVLGVFLVYARSLGGGFVYDDHYLVERNRAVHTAAAPWRFFADPGTRSTEIAGLNSDAWRPLTALSYALDYAAAGPRPWFFRTVNLLLHCLAALLLLRLAGLLGLAPPFAAGAAAFFALSPAGVEGFAWIASRSNALCTPLALLSLYFFAVYARSGLRRHGAAAGAALAAALLAKEAAIVVPLLALAYLLLYRLASRARLAGAALWLGLPAALFLALRFAVLGRLQQVPPPPQPLAELLAVPFLLFAKYLEAAAWPFTMLITYTDLVQARLAAPGFYLPLALLACLLFCALVLALAAKGERAAAFGLAWFGLALLPVLNIVQMTFYMSERLLYLPSAGAALAAAAAGARLYARPRLRSWVRAGAAALLLAFAWEIQGRIAVWSSDVNLWRYDAARNPGNRLTRLRLAAALREAGDGGGAAAELGAALRLSRTPEQRSLACSELGTLYAAAGKLPEAENFFRTAVRLDPRSHIALYNLGKACALAGRRGEGAGWLRRSLAVKGDYAPAAALLASLEAPAGR